MQMLNPETSPDPHRTISPAQMREMIATALEQKFTGVARVTYLLGEELKLLIQNGEICELLLRSPSQKQRLPGNKHYDPEFFAPGRTGQLSLLKAPGRFLVCERASFEISACEMKKNVLNSELGQLFGVLEKLESATLVSLHWSRAQAYVVVPGSNLSIRQAVFIGGDALVVDEAALSVITIWDEPTCDLALSQGRIDTESWLMLHLGLLFEYISSHLLTQYGYLTGRIMVNSIVRSLSYRAQALGCEVSASGNQVQVQTVFRTTAEALSAYQGLLDHMNKQMATMVGASFLSAIKKQGLDQLNPFYANLAQFYGF